MHPKTIVRLAAPMRRVIGRHHTLVSAHQDEYLEAQREPDAAVSLAKYLIQHLESRHDAVLFARAVGMPGYINLR